LYLFIDIIDQMDPFTNGNFIDLSFVKTNKETTMKKTVTFILLMMILTLYGCAPLATATPTTLLSTGTTLPVETQIPTAVSPTEVDQSTTWKLYTNNTFGFGFQYASNWFGPSESISGGTLRVEVGSDKVYPYGELPDHPSNVKNSYNVVIQYVKNNQNSYWKNTYQILQNLKDGESLSDAKGLIIRVRQLDLGRFKGFEYIFTLSETAQTDHVYARDVMLIDEQTNDMLTMMGQPNNVEVSNGTNWRDVYQMIDEANQIFFHKILESLTISN
jgi:hypothetical protein